jgi:hypothetical protein
MCGNAHDAFLTDFSWEMHGPRGFPGVYAAWLQVISGGLAGGGDWGRAASQSVFIDFLTVNRN